MPGGHEEHLPLSPLTMAILLALANGDRHGYALMKEIELQSDGRLLPGTGSLYAALERLMNQGLIAESRREPGPDEDPRRRYYRITATGRVTARAEAERMVRVLAIARARALAPDLTPAPEGES